MIESNTLIFSSLDLFCANGGIPLANSGSRRWIASQKRHKRFLMHSKIIDCLTFTARRKIARFDLDSSAYLISVGFDRTRFSSFQQEVELDPAFLTVALAELTIRPKATPTEIRDVLEWSDLDSDASYKGHDHQLIASLYPTVRVFDISGIDINQTWSVFFQACLDECDEGATWIDRELANTLRALCELDSRRIPYKVLCRSVFDGDKSSFF